MCLAIPARITEIHDDGTATVSLEGVKKRVAVMLLDEPRVGEYVVIHVGYALSKVDPIEAERTLDLIRSVAGA